MKTTLRIAGLIAVTIALAALTFLTAGLAAPLAVMAVNELIGDDDESDDE